MNIEFWKNKKVAILGGASMIGSTLTDQLLELNPKDLWVVDDLSSGKLENLPVSIKFYKRDLSNYWEALEATKDANIVISLACVHGGRFYVDTHELDCYKNLSLDGTIFKACETNGVSKVVFSSSACAYPTHIQFDNTKELKLTEDLENHKNPANPDGAYGWGKLSAEKTLMAYAKANKFEVAICRFFTVYGERMLENHAIGAFIAKTFIHQEPFEIYGDGKQLRNWTQVQDTCRGIILSAEKLKNDIVNIGTEEVNTPNSACEIIWDYMKWRPKEIKYHPDKLVGVTNRIADASKAKELLGWTPKYTFREGLERTIDWYVRTHDVDDVRNNLQKKLFER